MASESDISSKKSLVPVRVTPDAIHSLMQITVHRLNCHNYLEWSQSVKLAIDDRGKLGFLTGETKNTQIR